MVGNPCRGCKGTKGFVTPSMFPALTSPHVELCTYCGGTGIEPGEPGFVHDNCDGTVTTNTALVQAENVRKLWEAYCVSPVGFPE